MKIIIGYNSAETYVKINRQYSHVYVKSTQSVGYFQESFFRSERVLEEGHFTVYIR